MGGQLDEFREPQSGRQLRQWPPLIKGKFDPKDPSLISALEGLGGQRHAPAALPPKNRYVTHFTGGCWMVPRGRSGRGRKTSLLPGFAPRTDEPIASRYTD